MNPYDFVRIDWSKPPERHQPTWHNLLFNQGGQPLYSGQLELDIYLESLALSAIPIIQMMILADQQNSIAMPTETILFLAARSKGCCALWLKLLATAA